MNFQESVKTQNSFVSKEDSSVTTMDSLLHIVFFRWEIWNRHAGLQTVGTAIFQQTRGQNICNIVTALIIHAFFVFYSCPQLCPQRFITSILIAVFQQDLLIVLKSFRTPSCLLTQHHCDVLLRCVRPLFQAFHWSVSNTQQKAEQEQVCL